MSLQCPRCTFITALRVSRPRLLPRHNRLLPTLPRRTFTTTLPLARNAKSKREWKEHKEARGREGDAILASLLARPRPNGILTVTEDEQRHVGAFFRYFDDHGLDPPKCKIEVIKRTSVEFGERSRRPRTEVSDLMKSGKEQSPWLYDYLLDDAGNRVENAAQMPDVNGPIPAALHAKQPEQTHKLNNPSQIWSKPSSSGPRKMIYQNQGSQFTDIKPLPQEQNFTAKGPTPKNQAPHPKTPVHANQVSTETMRQKLSNEWRQKEDDHAVAFKKGTNLDLIMERLIENVTWHMGSDEEVASANTMAEAGYDDYDIDPETYASRNSDMTPGSLVEVRYTDQSIPYLAVYLKNKTGNYSREGFVLTPQGSIQLAKADMSRFTLKSYIPRESVDILLDSIQKTGRMEPEYVQDITKILREFRAKVNVRYPNFSAKVDQVHAILTSEAAKKEGAKKNKVTTTEVAIKMTGTVEQSPEDRYATHLALLARRDLFSVIEGLDDVTEWEVKSLESVERAKRVEATIRESINDRESDGGKMIQGFVEKARKVIDFGRKARKEGKGVEEMEEELGVEWTDEEMDLLKTLEGALEYRRGQGVALKPLYPHVLGLVDRYEKNRLLDEQRLFEFLGEVGVCSPWEDSVLREPALGLPGHRAGIEAEEDAKLYDNIEKVEGSVEKLDLKDMMEGLRHDWGDMPVYCVDDVSTKDIDDGVSLEEIEGSKDIWLHVHIANPTAFLPMDHWISKIASKRMETFYGPARNYSMVPLRLSVEKLGLAPNRPAMTFSMRINPETGEQKETHIRASTVRNVKRVSYAYMDKLVGTKVVAATILSNKPLPEDQEAPEPDVNDKDVETLKDFYKLGWELLRRRIKDEGFEVAKQANTDLRIDNGHGNELHPGLLKKPALDVHEPTITIKFWEMLKSKDTFTAAGAIREAMTVAGKAAALWSKERGMMQMYRQHAFTWQNETEEAKWFTLLNKSKDEYGIIPVDFWKLYFPVGASKLAPEMGRHSALGVDGYIKVTSPLRRFADFVSHHIIQRQLLVEHEGYNGNKEELKKPMFTAEEMDNFCKSIRQREQMFRSADKASIRLWGIRLLKELWKKQDPRLPQEVEVEIISITKHPTPASGEIRGLGLSGARVYMPSNIAKMVRFGDVVKAKLAPWHWSTDSNNSPIVALEFTDFVKTMEEKRKELMERIGEGVRWEQT
ncbi:hypothetical protein TWF281_002037 [Arthrobotrys megalospora]